MPVGPGSSPEVAALLAAVLVKGLSPQGCQEAERNMDLFPFSSTLKPDFLASLPPKEQEEWAIRSQLAAAAGRKRRAMTYGELPKNPEAAGFTKEGLMVLLGKPGVLPALALYVAIINDNLNLRAVLQNSGLLESFYSIKNAREVEAIREAMKNWIKAYFAHDLTAAADAETIAWNLLYLSNVIEWNDSELPPHNRLSGSANRIPSIAGVKHSQLWMMMHPEEKLQAQISGDNAWGALGEWALNNMKHPGWAPDKEDILPDTMFETLFHKMAYKKGKFESFYDFLLINGKNLAEDPVNTLPGTVDWSKIGEIPFASYHSDILNAAVTVLDVIITGQYKGSWESLGNAFRTLCLDRRYRETVLLVKQGINVQAKNLCYVKGRFSWSLFLSELKGVAPNIFK